MVRGAFWSMATTRTPWTPWLSWPKSTLFFLLTPNNLLSYLLLTYLPTYPLNPPCFLFTHPAHKGWPMPESSGKTTAVSYRSHTTMPPSPTTYTTSNLTSKLSNATGLIKNSVDAKTYLEQRSLIVMENNFDLTTLANLFITTSFNPKIPDQPTNVIMVVALLMVSNLQTSHSKEIAAVIIENLQVPTTQVLVKT